MKHSPALPPQIKVSVPLGFDNAIAATTAALREQGFGVLTRVNLHEKFKEKLGEKIRPAAILGACAPELAFRAYSEDPAVAGFLPCNVVVRELEDGKSVAEITRPSVALGPLRTAALEEIAREAEARLTRAAVLLERICRNDNNELAGIETECWNPDLRWGLSG